MTNSHIDGIIGQNIRRIRSDRQMSLTDLANRMVELGHEPITSGALGRWERGDRSVPASSLTYLSQALTCPYSEFYQGADPRLADNSMTEQMMVEFVALPPQERKTLLNLSKAWQGNKIAIIKYIQRCHLDLPVRYRREVVAMGIHQREVAEHDGKVTHDSDVDYIMDEWRKLYK